MLMRGAGEGFSSRAEDSPTPMIPAASATLAYSLQSSPWFSGVAAKCFLLSFLSRAAGRRLARADDRTDRDTAGKILLPVLVKTKKEISSDLQTHAWNYPKN